MCQVSTVVIFSIFDVDVISKYISTNEVNCNYTNRIDAISHALVEHNMNNFLLQESKKSIVSEHPI